MGEPISALDELLAAAQELAALLRANYMLPNTWPESRRFLAAALAFEGPALHREDRAPVPGPAEPEPAPEPEPDAPAGAPAPAGA